MSEPFVILPLRPFTQADIWPIITGYETSEIYAAEKIETGSEFLFNFRLTRLETPYRTNYFDDFKPDDREWYLSLIPQGYSFGAYYAGRLIGFALGEAFPDKRLLRVWEFHVMAKFRRMGVGRALMEQVFAKARQDRISMVMLETQNANVHAIRFYRKMGFSLDSIDLSEYFHLDGPDSKWVAFYMKRRLDLEHS
jgi:ribosomal protein S18 acetylase RimI-like enzyme